MLCSLECQVRLIDSQAVVELYRAVANGNEGPEVLSGQQHICVSVDTTNREEETTALYILVGHHSYMIATHTPCHYRHTSGPVCSAICATLRHSVLGQAAMRDWN